MVNKKQNGKYSFRQRRNNTSNFQSSFTYNSTNNKELKSESKTKSKAAPLSKYRRKTANARERTRMREINTAFESLRKCVPQSYNNICASSSSSAEDQPGNEKLTKITTLRLAMMYIRTLSDALTNDECHTINLDQNEYLNTKPIDCDNIKNEQLLESTPRIENRKKFKKTKLNDVKVATSTVQVTAIKRQNKRRKMNSFDEHNYSDFTAYSLESDGESLNFSEEGNSPIQNQHKIIIKTNSSSCHSSSSSLVGEPLDLILPDLNDGHLNDMSEEDFSTPFLTSTDLDCMIHPFTDLFSDLVAEPTLDYLI